MLKPDTYLTCLSRPLCLSSAEAGCFTNKPSSSVDLRLQIIPLCLSINSSIYTAQLNCVTFSFVRFLRRQGQPTLAPRHSTNTFEPSWVPMASTFMGCDCRLVLERGQIILSAEWRISLWIFLPESSFDLVIMCVLCFQPWQMEFCTFLLKAGFGLFFFFQQVYETWLTCGHIWFILCIPFS